MAVLSAEQLPYQQQSARLFQERYERALEPWNRRAPSPVLGQSVDSYRRETLVQMKRLLPDDHELRNIQVRRMPSDALDVFDGQLCQACRQEAYNPNTVAPGDFRIVPEVDSNGMKMNRFVGPESFVKQMGRPGRRVVSFNTSNGPMDASGRFLRSSRLPFAKMGFERDTPPPWPSLAPGSGRGSFLSSRVQPPEHGHTHWSTDRAAHGKV